MTWMLTATGRRFDLSAPEPAAVTVHDVAAALAKICRFGGHTRRFYSVAEHSVHVSYAVGEEKSPSLCLLALLHDAHEAYTGDRIWPIKQLFQSRPGVEWQKQTEEDVQAAIYAALLPAALLNQLENDRALEATWHRQIKHADLRLLATEKVQVMPEPLDPADGVWPLLQGIEPMPWGVHCWSPIEAETQFLLRYARLVQRFNEERVLGAEAGDLDMVDEGA